MTLTFIKSDIKEGDVRQFVFQPDEPIIWVAGQFIHYTLPHKDMDDRGDERWFTISSAPSEGKVVITTRINSDRSSTFKKALLGLKPGDKVEADLPEGDFTVSDDSRNYVFVAGGIGITPFRSILTEAGAKGQQLHVDLLYANRTTDITFKSELDNLQVKDPNLKVDYIIQPDRLDNQVLEEAIKSSDNPLIYVSGPEPMVESLTEEIAGLGVSQDNIKGDYFPGYEAD